MQDNMTITNQPIMIKFQLNTLSNLKRWIITCLFLLLISTSFAQTYPVQVNTQVVPPYSVKLSDYTTITSEKLYVNLLLTDLNEIGRRVKLRLYVEGNGLNVRSNDIVANEPIIILDGGINTRLSNLDLKPYFELNNLNGISPNQYSNPLPDGGYSYCFEVFDYFTGRQLSQKSCTTIYLQQNNPPILNVPFKDDVVTVTNPQNILFTWTPRHTNAPNVQYEFTIKELWDTRMNPQTTFLASPIFYQTTTYTPTLLFGPAEPQLLPGKVYAWQVRAFVTEGADEIASFKNDGRSEIFWFKYIEDCHPPTYLLSEALTAKSVKVQWQTSNHLKYRIQYRKKGFDSEDDWFEVNSYTTEGTIYNLEPATTYEFRVGGQCTELSGYVYSPIQEFTTPNQNDEAGYNCGVMPSFQLDGTDPLPQLNRNDVFTAGDFPVRVKDVQGQNGTYSGWGYIVVPYLGDTKIKVGFESIKINTAYQLTDGVVQTDYSADWENIGSIDETIETFTGNNGEIKQYDATNLDLENVVVTDSGSVVLIGEDGQEYPIETTKPVTVTDKNGDQWTAHEDGTVTQGQVAEGGIPNHNNTNGVSNAGDATAITSKDVEVIFIPSGYYATDKIASNLSASKYQEKYETLESTDGNYNVLYKLVSNIPTNQEDQVTAEVSLKNGVTTDDIIFKTQRGSKVPVSWSGNTATLTLKNQFKFAKEALLATVKPKDSTNKYEVAGKLNLWHAQQRTVNVTLIGVNGESVNGLKDELNQIYNPAGIHFNVTEKSFTITEQDWDVEKTNGVLDVGDSDVLANYTVEERAIFNEYKKQNGISGQEYYLFVIGDKIPTSKSIEGFMPLARQYGFIFNADNNIAKTVAHELGHGVFGLKHPFKEYGTDEYENTYLMSYGNGTKFTHMDWQKLHAPGLQFYIFQGDEDGQSTVVKAIPDSFKNSDGKTYTFMTVNGSFITLPDTANDFSFSTGLDQLDTYIDYPAGALISFKIEGKKYKIKVDRAPDINSDTLDVNDLSFTYNGFEYQEGEYNKYNGSVITLIPFYKNEYTQGVVTGGIYGYSLNKRKVNLEFRENDEFNIVRDYDLIKSIYAAEIEKSKHCTYKTTDFPHQYELDKDLMNEVIKDGSWTSRHAIVIKYAILNNSQPEIFKQAVEEYFEKDFVQVFRDNNLQSLLDGYVPIINLMRAESKDALEQFYNIVRNHNNGVNIVKAYAYDLYQIISKLSSEHIKEIGFNDRKTAFKILLSQEDNKYIFDSLAENITSIDRYENEILRLIKFIPNQDINSFIEYLETGINNKVDKDHLWHFAFHKLDDATFFWNKDNRKNFIRILTNHYYKSQRYQDELKKFNNWDEWKESGNSIALRELKRREIVGDYQSIYERGWNQLKVNNPILFSSFDPSKAYTKYDADYEQTNGAINIEKNYSLGFMYNTQDRFSMAPFDLMYYRNKSKLANLQDYNTKKLVPLPAIVLYYDDKVQTLQTTEDVIQLSIDVATLAIPGGQLDKVGRVLYLLDKASSVASISSEVLKNENPEASNLLNVLSIAFGVADLTNITKVSAAKKLNNSLEENFNDFTNALNKIENTEPEVIAKLSDDNKKGLKKLIKIEKEALKDAGQSVDEAKINSVLRKLDAVDEVFDFTKTYKGVKFEEFIKVGLTDLEEFKQKEVFKRWAKIDVDNPNDGASELYNYMKAEKINLDADGKTPWPPYDGFLRKPKILNGEDIIKGKTDFTEGNGFNGMYDRFQGKYKGEPSMNLAGGFASPVFKGEYNKIDIPYTYDSRAILSNLENGTVYIKFRIKDATSIEFKYGKALPWKGREGESLQGMAMQIKSNINLKDIDPNKYDIVQKSIYEGNRNWRHIIHDKSIKIDEILSKVKNCN